MSRPRLNSAEKRWILHKQDENFAGESKTVDRILKHTVLVLHRAARNSDMGLMCARLMFFSKKELNVSDNSLLLRPRLILAVAGLLQVFTSKSLKINNFIKNKTKKLLRKVINNSLNINTLG